MDKDMGQKFYVSGKGLYPVKVFTGHGRIRTRVHNLTCLVKTFTGHKPHPTSLTTKTKSQ